MKTRKLVYHTAGAPHITVEYNVSAEVDGETFDKNENLYITSKPVMDKLNELLALVDAIVNDTPQARAVFASPVAVIEDTKAVEDTDGA